MTTLLMISRSVFLICIGFYGYNFYRRKKQDVVIPMWLTIVVGMCAALISDLVSVNLGTSSWGSIQFSFYLYLALILYSLWRLSLVLKNRRR